MSLRLRAAVAPRQLDDLLDERQRPHQNAEDDVDGGAGQLAPVERAQPCVRCAAAAKEPVFLRPSARLPVSPPPPPLPLPRARTSLKLTGPGGAVHSLGYMPPSRT